MEDSFYHRFISWRYGSIRVLPWES